MIYQILVENAISILEDRFGVTFKWEEDLPNSVNEDELYHVFATYDCPEVAEDIVNRLIRADIGG